MSNLISSLKQDEDGATAVEFGLIAIFFIPLLMGLLEISLIFLADNILQSGTNSAARQVKTGQLIGDGANEINAFTDAVCAEIVAVISCNQDNIAVYTEPFDSSNNLANALADDNLFNTSSFDTGGAQDFVLVRVEYDYQIMTPVLRPLLATENNNRTLIATTIIHNEPF